MMKPVNDKYEKVINILRKSKPDLKTGEDIEREVIRKLSEMYKSEAFLTDVIDFLFGWVYIGWIRRTLVTASVLLVMVFVWQQTIILKQINYLSSQTVVSDRENSGTSGDLIEKKLLMYRITGHRFPSGNVTISEKQMKKLLEMINDLQIRYKDLENLIEENPELKKYAEERLIENNRNKTKL
jgi:hypothetical protein